MTDKRRFLMVVGTCLLAMALTGQAQNASNWRVYKAADGLLENLTSSVTVGAHSNIWAKHLDAAVSSLDGYEIARMPSPGLGNNRIYESAGGQIWTVAPEGLQQFKDGAWIRYAVPEIAEELRQNNKSVFHLIPIYPAKQNHVLFLTAEALMEFNGDDPEHLQTTVLRVASQTKLGRFSSMSVARDGGLWITGSKGLAKLPGPARNIKPDTGWVEHPLGEELGIQNLREPAEDDDGGVSALAESKDGTKQAVARFDGRDWSAQLLPHQKVMRIWRGAKRDWWAMNSYSLFQWHEGQQEMTINEELPAHRYFDLAVEPGGVFWLATSDGLFRYAPLVWEAPATQNLTSMVNGIAEDPANALWVASANSLFRFESNQWEEFRIPAGMSSDSQGPHQIFALTNGIVVVEAGERLLRFDGARGKFGDLPYGGAARLKPLGILKDGTLCVQVSGSETNERPYQLETYDGVKFGHFPYAVPDVDLGNELNLLVAAQNDRLWVCGNKGIASYRNNKWQLCGIVGAEIPDSPSCLVELSDAQIWCGIQDKIWEFDGKNWRSLRSGFDRVNAIIKGRDGSPWVAADNGLYHHIRGAWIANSVAEGLPSGVARLVYEDRRGQIWAGTTRGLSLRNAEADTDPPKTFVRNLSDPQNTVREGTAVNIFFGAQDKWKYTPADRLLFSYRLDDKEWSPYQEERSVSFTDLGAGKHYFKVRSIDRNGNLDPSPASLEFAVAVPWYEESRLVWISTGGLVVALFFAGLAFNRHLRLLRSYAEVEAKVALRTKELAMANQELFHSQKMNALGTLAAGIAHDFNNILSIIKGSAQIIEENPRDVEKIQTRTNRIKTVVAQGAGIVEAMLGFSGSDKQLGLCDVNAITKETIQLLGDRFRREVKVELTPPTVLPQVRASKDFIQQVLLNFIFNAAEALTDRRQIIVNARECSQLPARLALAPAPASSYVLISVMDFGTGIPPEIISRIFEPFFTTKAFSARRGTGLGLSMAYELARQMGAGLAVESSVGKGSVFTLILPVRDLPVDDETQKE